MQHSEINLPHGDIFCMSSFDGICSLGKGVVDFARANTSADVGPGGTKSLITIQTDSRIISKHRRLVSDPLAIHQSDHDLVYAGLRGSTVSLEDLRIAPGIPNVVAAMPGRKAIVGVKRLKDSAVPWGLAASAMGDEVSVAWTRRLFRA
jgi:WD repeat-containing protein 21A